MREFLELYLLHLQARNYSLSTLKQRARGVEKLLFYLENYPKVIHFNEVQSQHIKNFSIYKMFY